MKILHLSDAHFGLPDLVGGLEILLKALVRRAEELVYDVVIFTGDLAQSGETSQYETGRAFLERLRGKERRPLLVIPGNHDVQRSLADGPRLVHAAGSIDAFADSMEAVLDPARFRSFLSFASEYALPWHTGITGCCVRFDDVSFIGLNTALLCHRREEAGQLVVDVKRLNELLADEYAVGRTLLCLGHHPLKDLAPWNRELVQEALFRRISGAHLYLHGHLHEEHGAATSEVTGRKLGVFQAGATYTSSPWPLSFWHYTLDRAKDTLFPQLYRWNKNSGSYDLDPSYSYPVTVWQGRAQDAMLVAPAASTGRVVAHSQAGAVVTMQRLSLAWAKAQKRLSMRYLPGIHAPSSIQRILDVDLYSPGSVLERGEQLKETRSGLVEAGQRIADQARAPAARETGLSSTLEQAAAEIALLAEVAGELTASLAAGPGAAIPKLDATPAIVALRMYLARERIGSPQYHALSLCRSALEAVHGHLERLAGIRANLIEAGKPRAILGPAGCGKTHAGAAAVERALDEGRPALFLLAKGSEPRRGMTGLLQEALDLPSSSLSEILDGLTALASAALPSGAVRCLVVLDGVEETSGWQAWDATLADMSVESAQRPRLGFVAAMRPETAQQLPIGDYAITRLEEDGGLDLAGLLHRYAKEYNFSIADVPWLAWALRSPLEVRLLAEKFQHRRLTVEDGVRANLVTLFRAKLERIEAEARVRAGHDAWSEVLSLVTAILEALVHETSAAGNDAIPDGPLLTRLLARDQEFTARRVRIAIRTLVDHGLIEEYHPPTSGLSTLAPKYSLATRHVTDFIVAQELANEVIPALQQGKKAPFPEGLTSRLSSRVLFSAMLGEKGLFVSDEIWTKPPGDALNLLMSALSLLPAAIAAEKVTLVREALLISTRWNREVIQRLVLPIARIPEHPLGPRLLDEALRALPLRKRDPIWAVPDDLGGEGPWSGDRHTVLDKIGLHPEADDRWDGRPLLVAWSCASVVETRRSAARQELARWGAARLDQLTLLVKHMANVDDPQLAEDLWVAALGAAIGAPPDDCAIIDLAGVAGRCIFVEPLPRTPDVIVRTAARGIVERAALLFPGSVDPILQRARPPFHAGGWPALDLREIQSNSSSGGEIVRGDLSWYVANDCFDEFTHAESSFSEAAPGELDRRLEDAIVSGALSAPGELSARLGAARQEQSARASSEARAGEDALRELVKRYAQEKGLAAEQRPTDAEILDWARDKLGPFVEQVDEQPRYSEELQRFLQYVASENGNVEPPLDGARNGLIARLVRDWGWSEDEFCHSTWDKTAAVVDDAIAQRHGAGSSHGERSPIATFREKYVFAAVNHVAGLLADRLPVWDQDALRWRRLETYESVGTGMPDPLPSQGEEPGLLEEEQRWLRPSLWPHRFQDEPDLVVRANRWLADAPLPDPASFVTLGDDALLALAVFERGHESSIDQYLNVRSLLADRAALPLVLRDAPFVSEHWHEAQAWIRDGTYLAPSVASWAPWLVWEGESRAYRSFMEDGASIEVQMWALMSEGTAKYRDEDLPSEASVWIPSPGLKAHSGIIGVRGDRHQRSYFGRDRRALARETHMAHRSFLASHRSLRIPLELLLGYCEPQGGALIWAVQLIREATPALWLKGHEFSIPEALVNRRREVRWIVTFNAGTGFQAVQTKDTIEPWDTGPPNPRREERKTLSELLDDEDH